ncbi:hypothetical protein Spb1_17150 [Planctopirus ephydatiae]|uniref:Uncharacterized protein n=1 Tax=Planctopirus ephydatiae TaxID=2528019 RepID=A0A518GMF5_9PLAN|nr:hypothetical protein [Planctopirus ephydatiae]QDV29798.1 hypothetical protein Spb1_17150 [Planctopirus ephydatiae]
MSSTMKMLVVFDPTKPDSQTTDFLIPWSRDGQRVFLGLKSGKESALGMMVFIGRSITENDLFAKLVDSGAVIPDVDETLALLRSYVERLQSLKIGNVARIRSIDQVNGSDVELELVANTPSALNA